MPEPKAEWLQRLRQLDDKADLRFNYEANRWEFILTCADGKPRSQFWCQFDAKRWERYTDPITGVTVEQQVPDRDPVTGMMPYRELNDREFAVAIANLEKSFVANPFDGAGTTRKEMLRRYHWNKAHTAKLFREAGEQFADFVWDHRRQIRDAGAGPLVQVTTTLTSRPKVEV